MEEDKYDLAGSEGAQGGTDRSVFVFKQSLDSEMSQVATTDNLRDDLEEGKGNTNIENNQIFSSVSNPGFKKNSQKTLEFFQNLKSSNHSKKASIQDELGDPSRL